MNLLLVDSIDFPFGGAHSVHVSLLIKGLRENEEDIILIIPYGRKLETLLSNKNKYGHYDGVPFYFVRKKKDISKILYLLDNFWGVLKTAGLIIKRKSSKKVDGVILFGPDVLRDSPIILTCVLFRIPLYFWFVEKMSLLEDYSGIPGFLNYHSQKISEKTLPRLASGVIVISSSLKEHYLKYLPESKILISPILVSRDMHNKINSHTIDKAKEKLERMLKYKHLLVYSGSYGEKDGLYYLIDAFAEVVKKYADTLFIITGKSHSELIMNSVKEYINHLNLQDEIQLLGFVNSEELFCYNNLADILFACRTKSPFANHGFPWKLGEYCMTGKPIIATKVSDIELYFKDNDDLFIVEPCNSKAIAEKIAYIFDNYDKALIIANRGKETALKSFGYLEKTKEIIEFIKENNND